MDKSRFVFRPVLVDALKGYTRARFFRDLTAGISVGLVALPLAMAFAIASGASPMAGLVTAIVAGGLISACGGSRLQIGGPTGAFVVIVYGIVAQHGPGILALSTIFAGVILIIMGVARFGQIIQFIPYPVTMGFTSGIAVVIFSGQVRDFAGMEIPSLSPHFGEKVLQYVENVGTIDPTSLVIGLFSVILILLWPARWGRLVPASIVVIVLTSLAAALLHLPVATIGSRFGGLPREIPSVDWPALNLETLRLAISNGTVIALLGAIESLLSAVVADGLTGDRHDPDQELVGQGLANCVTPFLGGIPATGAIARTATNIRSGATSPVSGLVHAVTLALLVLVAAPLAARIPLATLAAILLVVAVRMGEWQLFTRLRSFPRSDAIVFLTTFGLTVWIDLVMAVEVGVVLAALLFIRRVAASSEVRHTADPVADGEADTPSPPVPLGVDVYHLRGAFFFGTANKLETALRRAQQASHTLVLSLEHVLDVDGTGLHALDTLHNRLTTKGQRLILANLRPRVQQTLQKSGLLERLGEDNAFPTLAEALEAAGRPAPTRAVT